MRNKTLKIGDKVKCIDDSPHGLVYDSDECGCSKKLKRLLND